MLCLYKSNSNASKTPKYEKRSYIGLFRLKSWNFFLLNRTPLTRPPVDTTESLSFGKSNVCGIFFFSTLPLSSVTWLIVDSAAGVGGGRYLGWSRGGLGARRLTRRRRLRSLSPGKLLYRFSSAGTQQVDFVESVSSAPLVRREAREPLFNMTCMGKFIKIVRLEKSDYFS